jgi:hypothetical protein
MLISKTGDKPSHRLMVGLRHFHLSPFFSYRPVFARTHDAKAFDGFMTLSVEFQRIRLQFGLLILLPFQ